MDFINKTKIINSKRKIKSKILISSLRIYLQSNFPIAFRYWDTLRCNKAFASIHWLQAFLPLCLCFQQGSEVFHTPPRYWSLLIFRFSFACDRAFRAISTRFRASVTENRAGSNLQTHQIRCFFKIQTADFFLQSGRILLISPPSPRWNTGNFHCCQ